MEQQWSGKVKRGGEEEKEAREEIGRDRRRVPNVPERQRERVRACVRCEDAARERMEGWSEAWSGAGKKSRKAHGRSSHGDCCMCVLCIRVCALTLQGADGNFFFCSCGPTKNTRSFFLPLGISSRTDIASLLVVFHPCPLQRLDLPPLILLFS